MDIRLFPFLLPPTVGKQYNTLSILSLCADAFVSKTTVTAKLLIAFMPELVTCSNL